MSDTLIINALSKLTIEIATKGTRLKAEQLKPTFVKKAFGGTWGLGNIQVSLASYDHVVGYVYYSPTGAHFKPNLRAVYPQYYAEYLHVLYQVQKLLTLPGLTS